MSREDILFSQIAWFSVDQHQRSKMAEEIAALDGNRLLNTSVDDLCRYFAENFRVGVPVLDREGIVADQRETQIDRDWHRSDRHVTGAQVEIAVPFSGDADVFGVQPTTYSSNRPRGEVSGGVVLLRIVGTNLQVGQVRQEIKRQLEMIEEYLANLRKNAEVLNGQLEALARAAIEQRRSKLLANQNLVSSLGFKIKKRNDVSGTYTAPEVRRKIRPTMPPASSAPYVAEPVLAEQDYEHILKVLENMAHVFERSPAAFATIGEESLRTHFLVQLNGHYEGQATGETFNYEGKTDILIRSNGKNIFIAECKYWTGPKKLTETLDQLLGYSSWRDTKVAVIIFNRNKDFTRVLESIDATTESHPNCKRALGKRSETSFRYVFSHRDDANRELTVTVTAFDVPT